MKKITCIIMSIWGVLTAFVTPPWLVLAVLNITGLIYKYDYSMDEGTAGIIGASLLIGWVLSVLVPDILFIRKLHQMLIIKK